MTRYLYAWRLASRCFVDAWKFGLWLNAIDRHRIAPPRAQRREWCWTRELEV